MLKYQTSLLECRTLSSSMNAWGCQLFYQHIIHHSLVLWGQKVTNAALKKMKRFLWLTYFISGTVSEFPGNICDGRCPFDELSDPHIPDMDCYLTSQWWLNCTAFIIHLCFLGSYWHQCIISKYPVIILKRATRQNKMNYLITFILSLV